MTTKKMTRQEEHDIYADPDNQTPQGPARRRRSKLSEPVQPLGKRRHAQPVVAERSGRSYRPDMWVSMSASS